MQPKQTTLIVLSCLISIGNASLLLFSNRDLEIPALETFRHEQLGNLLEELNRPKVLAFKVQSASLIQEFHKKRFVVANSAYVPSEEIELNQYNVTVLDGSAKENSAVIENQLNLTDDENNVLLIFQIEDRAISREKRHSPTKNDLTRPVLYSSKDDLIYSSKPLLFKNGTTEIRLGNAFLVTANVRKNARIVKANVDLGNNSKMSLSFTFAQFTNGYWRLLYIEIEFHNATTNIERYNVSIKRPDIMAPARFSYHCSATLAFRDQLNNVELQMYDMQMQIATKARRFNDAYDCVTFTTTPIWSGLFVTMILGVGLIIGLSAIINIKTMDKFDNNTTRQLNITVFE